MYPKAFSLFVVFFEFLNVVLVSQYFRVLHYFRVGLICDILNRLTASAKGFGQCVSMIDSCTANPFSDVFPNYSICAAVQMSLHYRDSRRNVFVLLKKDAARKIVIILEYYNMMISSRIFCFSLTSISMSLESQKRR